MAKDLIVVETERNIITFKKPYIFEGTEYKEIELGDLDRITGAIMEKSEALYRHSTAAPLVQPEMTVHYSLCTAAVLTGKPLEFFTGLPGREAMKIKGRIVDFLTDAE